ncbi:hypothetical protein [Microcoleus sp. PH2017_30_WIL_O_A]|uniref:hypothetical protein n=1 Tax=Microcoleus sp. PH2017_30_WIL_O_A TaxID=2798840 RepID=UPI001DABE134|nr:hypothetical protein [Microcoleus sp. PH2017_30_WIL_O_A]MCC3588525.1 hypothetical protein [Microcoleus sp. PH2017_30_WIL_O_A]
MNDISIQSDALSGARFGTGKMPVPQKKDFFDLFWGEIIPGCGTGILPVPQKNIFLICFLSVELSPVHQLFAKYYGLFMLT